MFRKTEFYDRAFPNGVWERGNRLLLVAVVIFALCGPSQADDVATERVVLHTGRRLDQELQRPLNIVLNRTTPRAVVGRLRELHHVALLLDRRIDPDQPIDVQLVQTTLGEGLELFAVQLDADFVRIGGTLFIGPVQSTDRIRTLIALRTAEVRALTGDAAVRRQFELLRGTTIAWDELAEPAQLFADVARSFHVEHAASEPLPHDLWGQGTMADVNGPEALSLLLGQFDRTFAWEKNGDALRIIPAPSHVSVEQSHTPRGMTVAKSLERIRQEWPHLKPRADGRTVIVSATAGEHDAISALIAPKPATQPSSQPQGSPLSNRRFTLTAKRAEAIAIIRHLESQDVTVSYDPDALKQASISLRQKVTLELKEATVEELFDALCDPLGLTYTIVSDKKRIVRLSPKPR